MSEMKNTDLIGKTYHWDCARYRVTEVDAESPHIIHAVNLLSGVHVCAIADFVRPHLIAGDNGSR